jgi:UDP-N-acetylmuramate: L-alanyl-gamma-D-glutamyl-meso-diaminopimelate ligase
VVDAFVALTRSMGENGTLIISAGADVLGEMRQAAQCRVVTVGHEPSSDWRVIDHQTGGKRTVTIHPQDASAAPIGPFTLGVPGRHNVDNAALAAVAAHFASIDNQAIIAAMDSFTGVKRRLDVVADRGGIRLMDDFAHHPTAVAASIAAIKECNRRVWAIFEPRSTTSRSPLFQDEYCKALALADRVTIGPVASRANAAAILDTSALAEAIGRAGVPAIAAESPEAIVAEVTAGLKPETDLLVMSSGPFGGLVETLKVLVTGRQWT